ncbi:MAG: hypothetical protein LRZ85_02910 [Alphaproteobacteria bacterium]|nr:hypothetical protein [Alphaproteobacteria bacterium]
MMKYLFILILFIASPALAHLEDDYNPGEPLATTPWYEWMNASNIKADLDFIEGMRPHHAGRSKCRRNISKAKAGRVRACRNLSTPSLKIRPLKLK